MTTSPPSVIAAAPRRRRARRTMGRLLSTGCVMGAAIMIASIHQRGDAQTAFQGTGSLTSGDAFIQQGSAPNTDTILVNSSSMIDWDVNIPTPTGSYDFLPADRTVNFVSSSGSDYTILNRINVSSGATPLLNQIIELNGTIRSTVGGVPGGNVWFYTPGGFLVGGTATIDVGGLVLSTSQIDPTSSFDGSNGSLHFTGLAANAPAGSTVRIASGASISAGNYVVMVAPRIEQSGTVGSDGNIVYIAAEAADITISNGLFDIVVPTNGGTGDANGIVHDGTTTGGASTGFSDVQRIYMAAVPKNQAMTMLLSGTIGYTPAASAINDGSGVILSAGYDISGGDAIVSSGGLGTGSATIAIGASTLNNATSVSALNGISLTAGQNEAIDARSSLSLRAGDGFNAGTISVTASGNGAGAGTITVAGDLYAGANGALQGGTIAFLADGGDLTFTRVDATASAHPFAAQNGPGDNATGGSVTLTAGNGGTIGFGDNSRFDVHAYGGDGTSGGNGHGGTITFLADGGTITGTGTTYVDASGYAGYSDGLTGLASGSGTGGDISIATGTAGGSLSFGTLDVGADGNFIDLTETSPNVGNGGNGTGGTISITLLSGTLNASAIAIHANGTGIPASAQNGSFGATIFQSGNGKGGTASFDLTGGSATITTLAMHADGSGGSAESGNGVSTLGSFAGNGTGGSVRFTGSSGSLVTTSSSFTADGYGGGTLPYSGFGIAGANAGNGTGGTAVFSLTGTASFTTTDLTLSASGQGGQGGTAYDTGSAPPPVSTFTAGRGGDGTGGDASLTLTGGALSASGTVRLSANGSGGAGGENRTLGTAGAGGAGTGGAAAFTFASEGHSIAALEIGASGAGGAGGMARYIVGLDQNYDPIYAYDAGTSGVGGSGTGGGAILTINNDPTLAALTIDASGTGGQGGSGITGGRGGDGFGGTGASGAQLLLNASTLTVTGATSILSNGMGGAGGIGYIGTGGDGGDGFGGTASILARTGSTLTLATTSVLADGIGGTGGDGGAQGIDGIAGANGGSGTGGAALIRAESNGAILLGGTTVLRADGTGADGREGTSLSGMAAGNGGNAGNGAGGSASIEAATGGSISQNAAAAFIQSASGSGGAGANGLGTNASGGNGAAGASGGVFATLISGGTFTVGNWAMTSRTTAGAGGTGTGTGTAGTNGTASAPAGSGIFVSLTDATISGSSATLLSDSTIDFSASGTGTMALSGDFTATATDTIRFGHASRPASATTLSANDIVLTAGGPISASGGARLRAAGLFQAESLLGGISLTDIGSGSDTTLIALNGAILVSTDLAAAGLVSVDGTAVTLTSLGDIAFDHATASAGDFTLTARGTARFLGNATGTSISVNSGDIDMGSGALLIAANDVALGSSTTGTTNHIGGADVTGTYSLSAAEIARIVARNLSITTPTQTVIGGLTIAAGTGVPIASDGRLTITSAGRLRVEGAVALSGLTPAGGLTLRSTAGIDVVTDSALIDLRNGAGGLGGTLLLESTSVTAATQAAIDDMAGAGTPVAIRNSRLGQNDGIVSEEGALRAGSIGITVSQGVYIQNSGASTETDARRGFTANDLAITTSGNAAIVINGRLMGANGTFTTGLAALQQVGINGQTAPASGYAAGSTINGCMIANPASCIVPFSSADPAANIPHRNEDIAAELTPGSDGPGGDGLPTVVIELKEFEEMGFPPLIDEPVTGNGNDDLWTSAGCAGPDGQPCGPGGQP